MTEPGWTEKGAQTSHVPSKNGYNRSSYTFIQKNREHLRGLNNTHMQTEKWPKHTLKPPERRSICIPRQQAHTCDIAQCKKHNNRATGPSSKDALLLQTQVWKKDSEPRETLFVITQPQLQINWPITVSRPTDESEKQWLLRDSQPHLFPSDDDLSEALATQSFENLPTCSN